MEDVQEPDLDSSSGAGPAAADGAGVRAALLERDALLGSWKTLPVSSPYLVHFLKVQNGLSALEHLGVHGGVVCLIGDGAGLRRYHRPAVLTSWMAAEQFRRRV